MVLPSCASHRDNGERGAVGVPTTQSYLLMTDLADTNGLYIHATNQISKKWETRELIMGYRPQAVQDGFI